MGIATPPLHSFQFLDKQNLHNSMSQDYHHQGVFGNFEKSQYHHQQIPRDKLRVQDFGPPPPLVRMEEEEEEETGGLPGYETAGILSEMFNFPSNGPAELLENQISQGYRNPPSAADWLLHRRNMVVDGDNKNQTVLDGTVYHQHHNQISSVNGDSAAAAMQLFHMNPQQQKSPSPQSASSTLHMLLPGHSSSFHSASGGGAFGQFAWGGNGSCNPNEIPGVVEGQGLSLSLSSSLKAEELRMGEGGMMFFGGSTPPEYHFKNLGSGGVTQNRQVVGPASYGAMSILRNSKYLKAAQELLEEFCSVGRGQLVKNKNQSGGAAATRGAASGGANSDLPPLSASDRLEHQRRKVKLISMLDEASLSLSLNFSL